MNVDELRAKAEALAWATQPRNDATRGRDLFQDELDRVNREGGVPDLDRMLAPYLAPIGAKLRPRRTGPVYQSSRVKRLRRTNAELDELDNIIVNAIAEDAPVTLRGVYYRVVSAGAVDKTEHGYQLVGRQLLKLRRSGRVDYDQITDGTRYILKPDTYSRLDRMLANAARTYRRQLWDDQDVNVQVFTEKDAITGVIQPVTDEWDVPLAVVRGYCSESFAYSLGESVRRSDKPVFIYQLGDHDPSGVDAWRDLQRKVRMFAPEADVTFERLAVTPDQIEELGLLTRPTKRTDTRSRGFVGQSVEVDAIPAGTIRDIVRQAIEQHIDKSALDITMMAEQSERDIIATFARSMDGAS